jgi:peroxiredoxin
VARLFGAYRPEGYAERALFVIDKKGKIAYKDIHEIGKVPDKEVIFEVLGKLA